MMYIITYGTVERGGARAGSREVLLDERATESDVGVGDVERSAGGDSEIGSTASVICSSGWGEDSCCEH